MKYRRMPIEVESPEQFGYDKIKYNLTESSVRDLVFGDLDLKLDSVVVAYTDHLGKPELREAVASEGAGLSAGDVTITAGAAAALFVVATSLLEANDHIVVAHPNYATNIETPRAIGCKIDLLPLKFEEDFRLDIGRLESLIRPETKLISLTCPHNPTGSMMTQEDVSRVIELAERHKCWFLLDETYREMAFGGPLPLTATQSDRAISVASLSKAYGLPGIRMGWVITKNPELQELFLAAKEQIFICNSIVDEEIAYQAIRKKEQLLSKILADNAKAFGMVKNWIESQNVLEWVEPKGGVVCFPRIREDSGVNVDKFYHILNNDYGTFVGPGHWFEMDRRFMRIGYGWPTHEELGAGLECIGKALRDAKE